MMTDDATDDAAGPADRIDALTVVAESLGATIVTERQVHAQPRARGLTTGHRVELQMPDDSRQEITVYLDDDPHSASSPGVLTLAAASGATISAWVYPTDPRLPTLPAAVFPDAAAALLRRLGFDAAGLRLEVVAYRPGKRAVVRMASSDRTLYLKVVRPPVVVDLVDRHERWASAGIRVPRVAAWSPDGLIALDPLPGIEASTIVDGLADDDAFLEHLDDLSARIARVRSASDARASLVTRTGWYRSHLRTVSPGTVSPCDAGAVDHTVDRIDALHARAGPCLRPVTIHGDLHLGQVFVEGAGDHRIAGVLDIDTAGMGDPADDAAALWAHLVAIAETRVDDAEAGPARQLAQRLATRWYREDDAAFGDRVTARAAIQLLGHALAGTIPLPRALTLADDLIAANERALTPDSSPSHPARTG